MSHFKSKDDHIKQIHDQLTTSNSDPIHLLTIFIFDFCGYKPFQGLFGVNDVILSDVFADRGRIIDLFLSKKGIRPNIKETEERIKLLQQYYYTSDKLGLRFTIFDGEYTKKLGGRNGIIVFRRYDPRTALFK